MNSATFSALSAARRGLTALTAATCFRTSGSVSSSHGSRAAGSAGGGRRRLLLPRLAGGVDLLAPSGSAWSGGSGLVWAVGSVDAGRATRRRGGRERLCSAPARVVLVAHSPPAATRRASPPARKERISRHGCTRPTGEVRGRVRVDRLRVVLLLLREDDRRLAEARRPGRRGRRRPSPCDICLQELDQPGAIARVETQSP